MRERLDCALLFTRCTEQWVEGLIGSHAGGRLHIHAFEPPVDLASPMAAAVLSSSGMALRRYDACILAVTPATLPWARISLSQAKGRLQTPVMAYVRGLTAAGLHDLYELGMADFFRDPFCSHELRIRLERLLDHQRLRVQNSVPAIVAEATAGTQYTAGSASIDAICEDILAHSGPDLEAYAEAAASRYASSRESFREAKSKVIERFERAYITAALGRHGGNIAMAARAAQKHRRAFWALMRKHDIDAAPFRALAEPPSTRPAITSPATSSAPAVSPVHGARVIRSGVGSPATIHTPHAGRAVGVPRHRSDSGASLNPGAAVFAGMVHFAASRRQVAPESRSSGSIGQLTGQGG